MRDSFAEWFVSNSKLQDDLLYLKVRIYDALLSIRSVSPFVKRKNVYHLAVQKTGSHYIKAVFKHDLVVKKSGLRSVPGRRYEWTQPKWSFPKGTFVPALFISYWHFKEIKKRCPYSVFAVQRDPRDIVVSWYYSALETHRLAGSIPYHRKKLETLSFQEGIRYSIDYNLLKFEFMRSWYSSVDDDILIIHLENLKNNPVQELSALFDHVGLSLTSDEIEKVSNDVTVLSLRQKDANRMNLLKRSLKNTNHYRGYSGSWKELWSDETKKYFYEKTGDLIEFLGYEK